ncbi:hypothetical protein [Sphingomonas sp.]|jgi:hypothetical protein|uniref:hypothetical protein n=1 Tax=Sphingomonas sp. TaxID=28214 RepID=UPI0026333772|nr:hypothetical protein [Sphingomonas sp.]
MDGDGEYDFAFLNRWGFLSSRLTILENIETASRSTDPAASLTSVSYYNWSREWSDVVQGRLTGGVFGYPTQAGDSPTSGTQTFSGWVRGNVLRTGFTMVTGVEGTATVTLDYSGRTSSVTFNLRTKLPPMVSEGARINFGTFTAQGSLAASEINASVNQSGYTGTLTGRTFGQAASEVGLAFALSSSLNNGQQRFVGAIVARR